MNAYDFCGKIVDKIEFLCMAEICEEIIKFGKGEDEKDIARRVLEKYDGLIDAMRYLRPHMNENWKRAKRRIAGFVVSDAEFKSLGILFKMHIVLGQIISVPEVGRNATMMDIDEIVYGCIRKNGTDSAVIEAMVEAARYMRRLADNYYSA